MIDRPRYAAMAAGPLFPPTASCALTLQPPAGYGGRHRCPQAGRPRPLSAHDRPAWPPGRAWPGSCPPTSTAGWGESCIRPASGKVAGTRGPATAPTPGCWQVCSTARASRPYCSAPPLRRRVQRRARDATPVASPIGTTCRPCRAGWTAIQTRCSSRAGTAAPMRPLVRPGWSGRGAAHERTIPSGDRPGHLLAQGACRRVGTAAWRLGCAPEYPILHAQPLHAEQDPHAWWDACVQAVRRAPARGGGGDRRHRLIRPNAWDGYARSRAESGGAGHYLAGPAQPAPGAGDHSAGRGRAAVRITGSPLSTGFLAASVRWMQQEAPGTCGARCRCCSCPRTTCAGDDRVFATDPSDGAGTLLLDEQRRDWSDELLRLLTSTAVICRWCGLPTRLPATWWTPRPRSWGCRPASPSSPAPPIPRAGCWAPGGRLRPAAAQHQYGRPACAAG